MLRKAAENYGGPWNLLFISDLWSSIVYSVRVQVMQKHEDSSFHTGLSKKTILPEDFNFKAVDTNLVIVIITIVCAKQKNQIQI